MILPPPAIFGIGRNYAAHASEMRGDVPDHPVVFMKNPAAVTCGDGEIVIPTVCTEPEAQVDYEGELAVIIGKTCRDLPQADALDVIGGYAAANDVSARWWQKHGSGGQFVRGKSFDTFCPISDPVTPDDVGNPQDLRIVTRLNDTVMQDGTTANMIFPIAALIAELSRGMTLLAGTVILTGTPAGVGVARTPPRFLRPGDVIEVEVERVGIVRSTVRDDASL